MRGARDRRRARARPAPLRLGSARRAGRARHPPGPRGGAGQRPAGLHPRDPRPDPRAARGDPRALRARRAAAARGGLDPLPGARRGARALRGRGRGALLPRRGRRGDHRLRARERRHPRAGGPRHLRGGRAGPDPDPVPRHRGPDQPAAVLGRDPDRLLASACWSGSATAAPGPSSWSRRSGATDSRRGEEFAEALYGEGLEASLLDPAGLDLAAASLLGSTTHISVLDADGMCANVTCSNGSGSGVLVPGTGVILNNMLGEEDLNPLGFHRIPPGRRVPSMMAPTVVLRDGEIELGLGSAGSNRIRSAILQTIVRTVEQGMSADRGGGRAAPPFRAGHRPGRARDRRGGARPPRGARGACRPAARDQPILRRRAGRRPRSRDRRAQRRRRPAPRGRGGGGMSAEVDFQAEGLLEGVEGEAREARLQLLEELSADGASVEELREAVEAGRLTLLPVERALAGSGPRHTAREVAELAGIELDLLQSFSAALGIPIADPDERGADRRRRRGREADERLPRSRPAGRRDAPGRAHDRHGDVADRRGQPRDHRPHPDAAGRHRARPRPPLRRGRRVHAAPGRPDPPLRLPVPSPRADPPRRDRRRRPRLGRDPGHLGDVGLLRRPGRVHPPRRGDRAGGARLGRRPLRGDGDRSRRTAGAAGEDDRRRGDAGLLGSRAQPAGRDPADRVRRGRRRGVPLPAGRPRLRADGRPDGRLLRPRGQPGQPHHRRRQARQRRRRRGDQGRPRRRLQVHLHRRAPDEGDRLESEALPRPLGADAGKS